MARKEKVCVYVVGALVMMLARWCGYSSVFAKNPVDISIIEMVDDGAGGYKPWEDVTGAMPGMTYSMVPVIRNEGATPVRAQMCLVESVVGSAGEVMRLSDNAFLVNVGEKWKLSGGGSSDDGLTLERCYNYTTVVSPGAETEPFFTEVTLSSTLGSIYGNGTFSLHLDALATEDTEATEPGEHDYAVPNTGAAVESRSLTLPECWLLVLGAVVLMGMVVRLVWRDIRKV